MQEPTVIVLQPISVGGQLLAPGVQLRVSAATARDWVAGGLAKVHGGPAELPAEAAQSEPELIKPAARRKAAATE